PDFACRLVDQRQPCFGRIWYVLAPYPNPASKVLVMFRDTKDSDCRHSRTRHPVVIFGSSQKIRDHSAVRLLVQQIPAWWAWNVNSGPDNSTCRSEERRVGKECKSRLLTYQ